MHKCRAASCALQISDSLLMCRPHWYKVSKATRNRVWKFYRDGPASDYLTAVRQAIREVASAEAPDPDDPQLEMDLNQ